MVGTTCHSRVDVKKRSERKRECYKFLKCQRQTEREDKSVQEKRKRKEAAKNEFISLFQSIIFIDFIEI